MSAPNLKEIEWAISELEQEESSEKRYELLAALYTCRNEMTGATAPPVMAYSKSSPPSDTLAQYGDSEFLRAAAGKDAGAMWMIMDELMETLQVVNPRAYNSVMRKIERG